MAIVLQEAIAAEVKMQVETTMAEISYKAEHTEEQIFRAATLSGQGGISTVLCEVVEHFILDQIMTALLGETIDKHVIQARQIHRSSL